MRTFIYDNYHDACGDPDEDRDGFAFVAKFCCPGCGARNMWQPQIRQVGHLRSPQPGSDMDLICGTCFTSWEIPKRARWWRGDVHRLRAILSVVRDAPLKVGA